MNIKTKTIVEMVEAVIKNNGQHFNIPLERRAIPDVAEYWRLDLADFEIKKLAIDILKVVDVGLTEHFIRDILTERGEGVLKEMEDL